MFRVGKGICFECRHRKEYMEPFAGICMHEKNKERASDLYHSIKPESEFDTEVNMLIWDGWVEDEDFECEYWEKIKEEE